MEDEGNVFDSIYEVEEGSDSEYVPDSSTFSEASGEASELDAIDEMEVEIATNQVPTLLPNNGSIPVAAPELPQSIPVAASEQPQSIPVAAPEMSQRGRGRRGRGRGHGRGKGQCRQSEEEPEGPDWKDDAKEVPDWLPNLVCPTPGRPSIDCTNYKPVDYFLATFPIEMINLTVNETNRYFDQWWQQKEDNATNTSVDIGTSSKRAKACWEPVTEAEMKAFLALMIIGNDKRLRYKSYWSTEWLISMEGFPSVMSCDRFMSILRFLHIAEKQLLGMSLDMVGVLKFGQC